MFRIIFDPRGGVFKVQLLRFGVWWTTVTRADVGEKSTKFLPRLFSHFSEAEAWVTSIGLDKAYGRQASYVAWLRGGVK